MTIFFNTIEEAEQEVKKITTLYRNTKIIHESKINYDSGQPKVIYIPTLNEMSCLLIVKVNCELKDQVPESPFYISMIKGKDFENKRYNLLPIFINKGKILTKIVGDNERQYPIISHPFDTQVIKHISKFNISEMTYAENQLPNYNFIVERIYSAEGELVYELNLFDQGEINEVKTYSFFKTKGQELAYALLKTDGHLRQKLLEITTVHYSSISLANRWKNSLIITIQNDPDLPPGIKAQALDKIEVLHQNMTGGKTFNPAFTSRAKEIVFYCLNTSGKTLMKGLGIVDYDTEQDIYADPMVANFWKDSLIADLQDDSITPEEKQKTIEVIIDLYETMINNDSFIDDEDINDR